MNFWDEVRVVFIFILIFCVGLLLTAFYMEFQLGLEPCPMCIVQRIAVALAGLTALIGILHDVYNSGYRNFYLGLIGLDFFLSYEIYFLYTIFFLQNHKFFYI